MTTSNSYKPYKPWEKSSDNSFESQEAVEIEAVDEDTGSEEAEFTLDKCLHAYFHCSVDIHILCGWYQNEIALKEDLHSACSHPH